MQALMALGELVDPKASLKALKKVSRCLWALLSSLKFPLGHSSLTRGETASRSWEPTSQACNESTEDPSFFRSSSWAGTGVAWALGLPGPTPAPGMGVEEAAQAGLGSEATPAVRAGRKGAHQPFPECGHPRTLPWESLEARHCSGEGRSPSLAGLHVSVPWQGAGRRCRC